MTNVCVRPDRHWNDPVPKRNNLAASGPVDLERTHPELVALMQEAKRVPSREIRTRVANYATNSSVAGHPVVKAALAEIDQKLGPREPRGWDHQAMVD